MEKDDYKTRCIFRYWKGAVIALFIDELYNGNNSTCMTYMHIGQHGMAMPSHIIKHSKLATEKQYQDLAKELETIGYDLDIIKKLPRGYNAS